MSVPGLIKDIYSRTLGGVAPSGAADASGDISQMIKQVLVNQSSSSTRIHVGHSDYNKPATDYWAIFAIVTDDDAASATVYNNFSNYGWSIGAGPIAPGFGADFMSAADRDPIAYVSTANGHNFRSPQIFGSYEQALIAATILGAMPTKLCIEFVGRFVVASANEAASFIGLATFGTGTPQLRIYSDGTNFVCQGGTTDAGAAIDTSWHTFRIEATAGSTAEWFIDGVSQGTVTIPTDVWPLSFMLFASTTNRPAVAWFHIWYE